MRTFLGVGKKTPIPGLYGETGWPKLGHHKSKDSIRYWLKVFNMDDSRLTKKVFNWDYRRALLGKKGWNSDIKNVLTATNMSDTFYGLGVEDQKKTMTMLENELNTIEDKKLLHEINTMPKLRTYKEIKLNTGTETYIKSNMSKYHRSPVAKMRTGTFPISIETGRYKKQPVQDRTCPRCPTKLEDEKHFMLDCPLYKIPRDNLYQQFQMKNDEDLENLEREERFFLIFNINRTMKAVARYIEAAYKMRANFMAENS